MVAPIAIAMGNVELLLNTAAVTRVAGIFGAGLLAEEVARDAFYIIQAEPVAPALIQKPPHGANEHPIDVFGDGLARAVERMNGAALSVGGDGYVQVGIKLGMGRLAN